MKLLVRRNQRMGIVGKIVFTLDVRAEISETERQHIAKYQLGDTVLYQKYEIVDRGRGLLGLISRLFIWAANLTIKVHDLTSGKRFDCKNIVEMLAVEAHVKEAGQTFNSILVAAAQFGGEEIIDLAA